MSKADEEFHALMQKVLAGSEEAAQDLFRDYEPYLLYAIRKRMGKQIRSKFDSMDFVQDVWASFFAELPDQRKFIDADDFVAFLTLLAQNKVVDVVRQRTKTLKHDMEREESLDDSRRFDKNKLVGRQQTPSQILMTQEEWVEFLRRQPLVYRQIFILLREGKKQQQIAEELGIHVKTVNRIVCRVATRELS
jgi:RNA polymerase sigma-70 factor (ECF subfamily)